QADAHLRGGHERLRVAEPGEKRQVERAEEALERLVDGARLAYTVGDYGEPDIVGADAARDQQVADEIRRGVDVDRRRRDRDEDAMRAREHLLQEQPGGAGRRVDHEL